ncbi:MAG: hypothetical protein ACK496_11940 [Acidobacteriota bacterium]|jgi:hypothetical protein
MGSDRQKLAAAALLLLCAGAGAALLLLFADSCQQDGGLHYLFARWAWRHPGLFVGVWSRPLYTTVYALPALGGYTAARALTVIICLLIAWQTWRLATALGFARSPLAILLVWLQPSFFLFAADNMTEQIFALVVVIALRLHHQGKRVAGAIVASLTILARPEGFFLGILWAAWLLWPLRRWRQATIILWLGTGALLWWVAALLITGDPLFILHNWPQNWPLTGTIYGAAGLVAYPARLPEIVGPFLLLPFLVGLWRLLRTRRHATLTSTFLLFFTLHTILRAWGLLGSAGYPRYLVAISPVIALITLCGWNRLADCFRRSPAWWRTAVAATILATSAWFNFIYVDGAEWSRDARAIQQVHHWFIGEQRKLNDLPVTRLIWNEPYACIIFDRDPWENPEWTHDRERDLETLRSSPPGTLVIWDRLIGPKWFGLQSEDFEAAGFRRIYTGNFRLEGHLITRSWFGYGGPRHQTYYLLYKDR